MARTRGLSIDRLPRTLDEARTLIAYNQRILQTSQSPQRRHRAYRMLVHLQPILDQLEAEARARAVTAATRDDGDYEIVFSGRDSLSKFRKDA